MSKWRTILRLTATCFLLNISVSAQSTQQSRLDVESLMSASEFRQAGLSKLSAQELAALNSWLTRYATKIYTAASEPITADTTSSTASAIESQIEGTFNGWSGDTIFKLNNGQIWQQASYAYTHHYAYRPEVVIYKTGSGYKMKVEGVDDTINVKRIK
jgi:hypothetical protein